MCPSTSSSPAQDMCWVCLGEASLQEPLYLPCRCPRPVHAACLARWQLHSAGSREELQCRFCFHELPDWKPILTPAGQEVQRACPTMSVTFNGRVHHVQVKGGPNGYASFVADIRRIFGIAAEHDMQLAFDCADPVTGQLVKLNGAGAYQAAVHCATVSAAKRLRHWHARQAAQRGPPPLMPAPPAGALARAATPDVTVTDSVEVPATPPRAGAPAPGLIAAALAARSACLSEA